MKLNLSLKDYDTRELSEWFTVTQTDFKFNKFGFVISSNPVMVTNRPCPEKVILSVKGLYNEQWNHNDWREIEFFVRTTQSSIVKQYSFKDIVLLFDHQTIPFNSSIEHFQWVLSIPPHLKMMYAECYLSIPPTRPLKICIVGMKHSGSTLLYNIFRTCMKRTFRSFNEYDGNETDFKKYDAYIWKSHTVPRMIISDHSWKIITTLRDVRDVSISGFLRFHYQQSINEKTDLDLSKMVEQYGLHLFMEMMHENILLFYKSLHHTHRIYTYEMYMENKETVVKDLFKEYDIEVTDDLLRDIIQEAENIRENDSLTKNLQEYTECKKMDQKIELLTKDHNTSGGQRKKYVDFFSPLQNQMILENPFIRDFLEYYGYLST